MKYFLNLSMQRRGVIALVLVTAVWGTTFPTMKLLTGHFNAMQIITLRFAVAVLILTPMLFKSTQREWRWGLGLGVLLFLSFALQVEGLVLTSSNRNAFITGLSVLMVPMMGLFLGQRPAWNLWVACALAVVGVRFLFWTNAPWNFGDTLTLGSAVCYAIHAVSAAQASVEKHGALPLRPLNLTMLQCVVLLIGALTVLLWKGQPAGVVKLAALPYGTWLAVLYLGTVASIGAIALQVWGQSHVAATPSAVIYGLEPVFASITALFMLGETLALTGLIGAGMIVAALVMSQLQRSTIAKLDEK